MESVHRGKQATPLMRAIGILNQGRGEIIIIEAHPVEFTSQPSGKPLVHKSGDDISTGPFQSVQSTDVKSQLSVFRLAFEAEKIMREPLVANPWNRSPTLGLRTAKKKRSSLQSRHFYVLSAVFDVSTKRNSSMFAVAWRLELLPRSKKVVGSFRSSVGTIVWNLPVPPLNVRVVFCLSCTNNHLEHVLGQHAVPEHDQMGPRPVVNSFQCTFMCIGPVKYI